MEKIAALLLAAHALGDFALQPGWLVARKSRWPYLLLHAWIHALVAYIILQDWADWQAPLFVFGAHTVIDSCKSRMPDTAKWFAIDQLLHVLSLLLLAWLLVRFGILSQFTGAAYQPVVLFAGLILTVRGSGFLIEKFANRLIQQNQLEIDGLIEGGKWIGLFERALIFLLVFIDQPAGIGFLVAAKSILRFEESRQQKLAEYVLIGTLLSFSLAIALSYLTKWALTL